MEVYERIKIVREHKRYSQYAIADMLGISQSAYLQLKKGKTELTVSRLIKIAEVLEVSVEELLGVEGKAASEDANRVRELEKRVRELEELTRLYKKENESLIQHVERITLTFYQEIGTEMIEIALENGVLNNDRAKGWLDIPLPDRDSEDSWYFDLEGIEEKGFSPYWDFFVPSMFSEDELIVLFNEISDNNKELLQLFVQTGIIKNEIILNAFRKYSAYESASHGFKWDENEHVWINIEKPPILKFKSTKS